MRKFWGYCLGNAGIAVLRQIVIFLPMYFYCPPDGKGRVYFPIVWFGYAMAIGRIVDAASDPVVGYLSDHTRHRWGKRLPYIVYGAPLWLLSTALIFTPPIGHSSWINFVFLAAMSSVYFISMTVVQVPYMAVLPEITENDGHTLSVSVRMGKLFIFGVLISAASFPLASKIGFAKGVAVVTAVAGLFLVFTVAELRKVKPCVQVVEKHGGRFLHDFFGLIKQRPFWTYIIGHTLFIFGYYCILVVSVYFVTEIVGFEKSANSLFMLLPLLTALASAPLIRMASEKFGKKAVMLAAMLLFTIAFTLWFMVGKLPWLEGTASFYDITGIDIAQSRNANFGVAMEAIVLFTLIGIAVAVQLLVPMAIVADLVAYDKLKSGKNREALIYGFQGGIEKTSVIAATVAGSQVLEYGNSAANPYGIYLIGPIAAVACLLGYLVFTLYPLGRNWRNEVSL